MKLLGVNRMLAPLISMGSSAIKPVLRNPLCSRGNPRVAGTHDNSFIWVRSLLVSEEQKKV